MAKECVTYDYKICLLHFFSIFLMFLISVCGLRLIDSNIYICEEKEVEEILHPGQFGSNISDLKGTILWTFEIKKWLMQYFNTVSKPIIYCPVSTLISRAHFEFVVFVMSHIPQFGR